MSIQEALDTLAELKAQHDTEMLAQAEAHASIIAPIKAQLDGVDALFAPKLHELETLISETEQAIKAEVLKHGTSVKGARLQAVYMAPRVTWDTGKLDGYAAAHPEINAFRKTGEPSVQLRAVK